MGNDNERSVWIISNIDEERFVAISSARRAALFDVEGRRVGGWLDGKFDVSVRSCLLEGAEHIAVGHFNQRTLSLYSCTTGERLWCIKTFQDMGEVKCCGPDVLSVTQYFGACRFYSTSGEHLRTLRRCSDVLGSAGRKCFALCMKVSENKVRIEVYEEYGGVIAQVVDLDEQEIRGVVVTNDLLLCCPMPSNNVYCYARDGRLLWQVHRADKDGYFQARTLYNNRVHLIYRPPGVEGSNCAIRYVIDAYTGKTITEHMLPMSDLASEPVGGRYFISPNGNRIDLETGEVTQRHCIWK